LGVSVTVTIVEIQWEAIGKRVFNVELIGNDNIVRAFYGGRFYDFVEVLLLHMLLVGWPDPSGASP
jgi:hypothetical protein